MPPEPASAVNSSVAAPPLPSPPPTATVVAPASDRLICHLQSRGQPLLPSSLLLLPLLPPSLPSSSSDSHVIVGCRHCCLQPCSRRLLLSLPTVALAVAATTLFFSLPLSLTLQICNLTPWHR
ncbi:hypothetical protein B296_00053776 [Ensete ventricosum]|uniref:Uncharacterized protein n=1 Tax=Ensete ventricosum TaxID=4639 RepID=A0A426X2P0_ENSVE|nr:hypothetical protein B296_00053776 [Ensete ventricosum]